MKILLVGTGGFGAGYIKTLLKNTDESVIWAGAADPYMTPETRALLEENRIPVFSSMEEYYVSNTADLTVFCTPTYLHREQCVYALSRGSHVLCEKPLAPTEEDGHAMLAAEEAYGKFIAIGFQWSYAPPILQLKRDILEGVLGDPISLKTAISWPRNLDYFSRSTGWAGSIQRNGRLVLDSIASNACAHYLHNMLFLLGERMEESARVAKLEGRCLRANAIENFDTCTLKMDTETGAKLYFAATHAADQLRNPCFEYRFTGGTVSLSWEKGASMRAVFSDGTEKDYGIPPSSADFSKLQICIDAIRQGTRPPCTVKTALPHAMCIEKLYRQIPVENFQNVVFNRGKNRMEVPGLFERLCEAYETEELL